MTTTRDKNDDRLKDENDIYDGDCYEDREDGDRGKTNDRDKDENDNRNDKQNGNCYEDEEQRPQQGQERSP